MHNGKFGNGKFCGLSCSKAAGAKARWGSKSVARKAVQQSTRLRTAHTTRDAHSQSIGSGIVSNLGKRAVGGGSRKRPSSLGKPLHDKTRQLPGKKQTVGSLVSCSPRLVTSVTRAVGEAGCVSTVCNGSSTVVAETTARRWAREEVDLPPKKKPRGSMMGTLLCRGSDTESDRSNALHVRKQPEDTQVMDAAVLPCLAIENGLVGEFISYYRRVDEVWKSGRLVEYRVDGDLHLRAVQLRFVEGQ
jgi:hypothetical protein